MSKTRGTRTTEGADDCLQAVAFFIVAAIIAMAIGYCIMIFHDTAKVEAQASLAGISSSQPVFIQKLSH